MRTEPKSKNSKNSSKKKFNVVPQETVVNNILQAASGRSASTEVSHEERHQLIAEAAYFHASQRSFAPGRELEDWLRAEAEIEKKLSQFPTGDLRRSM